MKNAKCNNIKDRCLEFMDSETAAIIVLCSVVGCAALLAGSLIQKNIMKKREENKKTKSYIVINNGEVIINSNIEMDINSNFKEKYYSIQMFDDDTWLIAVNCIDSDIYAEFIENNIYFAENNKIIFDIMNVNEESYEYFKEHIDETNKGSSRVRKG